MNAKQRFDAKRKGSTQRVLTEQARSKLRRDGIMRKTGKCANCHNVDTEHAGEWFERLPTVWHHWSYNHHRNVVELCYRCHRRVHPRRMPNGKIV